MSDRPEKPIERERPTAIGCAVMAMSLFVIFGTALPMVMWRDPETGQPLPRLILIFTPLLIGAAFHAGVDAVLRLIGSWTSGATRSKPTPEQTVDDLFQALEEERKKRSTEFFEKRDSREQ